MIAILCDNCRTARDVATGAAPDGWINMAVESKAAADALRERQAAGGMFGGLFNPPPAVQPAPAPPRSAIGPWQFCSGECAVAFIRNGMRPTIDVGAT